MKDCFFLVADKQMEGAFGGFLNRPDFHQRLRTSSFTFEITADYAGNDAGIYHRAHEILRVVRSEFQHAIVVLDHAFEGSRSAASIQTKIRKDLTRNGWHENEVEVIVIEPELEIWLWTPTIAQALLLDPGSFTSLRKKMEDRGLWEPATPKPLRPKEAFTLLCRDFRMPQSSALCSRITKTVSVSRCIDPAFCQLRETLQRWFPADGGEQ